MEKKKKKTLDIGTLHGKEEEEDGGDERANARPGCGEAAPGKNSPLNPVVKPICLPLAPLVPCAPSVVGVRIIPPEVPLVNSSRVSSMMDVEIESGIGENNDDAKVNE